MELYAIKYGENFKYGTYGTVFKGVENADEIIPGFAFTFYLIKYKEKLILIDTGFCNEDTAKDLGITLNHIEDEVKRVLPSPESVDAIIITHSHFDHINNLDMYSNATVYISKAEYEIAMKEAPDSVKERLRTGDVVQFEEEYLLEDKFLIKVIGGHTVGSSVIYFTDNEVKYVITGDECYVGDNIRKNIPIGNYYHANDNKSFIQDAHEKGLIPFTFHDKTIYESYEKISDYIVRILS